MFLATALVGFTAAGAGVGFIAVWQTWLGYASAALLFVSATATPYSIDRRSPVALAGLAGWLGWIVWVVAYSIILLGL